MFVTAKLPASGAWSLRSEGFSQGVYCKLSGGIGEHVLGAPELERSQAGRINKVS